jgi:hypothetical protein
METMFLQLFFPTLYDPIRSSNHNSAADPANHYILIFLGSA